MSSKFRTEYKSGDGSLTPRVERVINTETGAYVGEVVRWDYEDAGAKIAEGDWRPNEKADKK